MRETWKDIEGWEGFYQVSSLGRLRSLPRIDHRGNRRKGRILKPGSNPEGYRVVRLYRHGKASAIVVHRIVARAFLGEPKPEQVVNHKNGVKDDNRVENLEWCSRSWNTTHGFRVLGRVYKPTRTTPVVGRKGDEELRFNSIAEAVRTRGFHQNAISNCIAGKAKTHRGYTWSRQ